MHFRVVILNAAEQDLKALRTYLLKHFSIETWHTSYAKIKEAILRLQSFPQAGVIPEEIEKLHLSQYRQVLSGMNRIIYEIRHDIVYVHAIVDTRKNMTSLLTQRLLRVR